MSDSLERATRAYREETAPDGDGADALLSRIEWSRQTANRPLRRSFRIAALTLAAALIGAGAWASGAGGVFTVLAQLREAWSAAPPDHAETAGPKPSSRMAQGPSAIEGSGEAALEAGAQPTGEEVEPRVEAPAPPLALDEPRARLTRPKKVRVADAAIVATPEPVDPPAVDVDALYREAHDLHFSKQDYATAVTAWDRYLAVAGPGSRLFIEARYNRGIALARLGRSAEAIRALEPFANGEYGQYRRDDARRVIEKLRQ